MMLLPERFEFMLVETQQLFYAEYNGEGFTVSWSHVFSQGAVDYPYEWVVEYIADGSWVMVTDDEVDIDMCDLYECEDCCECECDFEPEEDFYGEQEPEEEQPVVAYGTVVDYIVLEDGTELYEGDEVVILACVISKRFGCGFGYVVFSEEHCESATVDFELIKIDEESGSVAVPVCSLD